MPLPRSRMRVVADPLTVGLSMVNWLMLMLLMSGLMLAATMAHQAEPATHSQAGTVSTH